MPAPAHSPRGFLPQLGQAVEALEGLRLLPFIFPGLRGYVSSEFPLLQFFEPLLKKQGKMNSTWVDDNVQVAIVSLVELSNHHFV